MSEPQHSTAAGVDVSGLRERLQHAPASPQHTDVNVKSEESARQTVRALNEQEASADKQEKDRRTYGRANGIVFTVPHTEDMVSQLFDPTQPKNASDVAIVVILAYLCLMYYMLPPTFRIFFFGATFLFWRTCYNAGIGWLLHNQSHHKRLVTWAKKSRLFEKPGPDGSHPRPFLYKFIKSEMEAKIPKDYKFDEAPIEYNTWLIFRRVVDLILMSDFTSYILFAMACGGRPANEKLAMTVARWIGGWLLVAFNLWVKLDAHRVVKDFAWYWGDFFYLIDQELTFDGVFELAPHPMYSVGYAGYYGISMMAASYKVLFISIIAHAMQLAFLAWVENPHIERTYNAPPPLKRCQDIPETTASTRRMSEGAGHVNDYPPLATSISPSQVHNLIGLENMDFHRVTDITVLLMQVYMFTVAFLTPSTWLWQALFVMNAVVCRLWYSIGIGYVLDRQSKFKHWTRHFVKYGESTEEAWRQWKGIYHISMILCYTSFICAAWKMYGLPEDWTIGMAVLRHVLGSALIALQTWTAFGIYESLGEFGWFYGDFFFHNPANQLTYGGIYRFLNNPERTIGLAGVWGAAIITWSKAIFFLALLSHTLTLCFIQFVERPHMQKLYRQSLRDTSGVSRSIKRSLPPPLQKWTGSAEKVLDDGFEYVDSIFDAAGPKLAAGFQSLVHDSRSLVRQFPRSMPRLASSSSADLAGIDFAHYRIELDPTSIELADTLPLYPTGREGSDGQVPQRRGSEPARPAVAYGAKIRVNWTAPRNHSPRDWIGLYLVGDNTSREITKVSSQGRWSATLRAGFDYNSTASAGILTENEPVLGADGTPLYTGSVEFSGDRLWWTQGVFEFRYHHAGKYHVLATSRPFEIRIPRILLPRALPQVRPLLEQALLPLVQACFDHDETVAPRTVDEPFGPTLEREGKYARRVVYAVKVALGVEFTPAVVAADGCVRNLAWRVAEAKKVLVPYSMAAGEEEEDGEGEKEEKTG